jgi:hypothetical protein
MSPGKPICSPEGHHGQGCLSVIGTFSAVSKPGGFLYCVPYCALQSSIKYYSIRLRNHPPVLSSAHCCGDGIQLNLYCNEQLEVAERTAGDVGDGVAGAGPGIVAPLFGEPQRLTARPRAAQNERGYPEEGSPALVRPEHSRSLVRSVFRRQSTMKASRSS